jgi:hypothetical protein
MHAEHLPGRQPPEPLVDRVDPLKPVVSVHDGHAVGGALEHVPGQIFRPFSLGDVGQGHEHAVEARGRRRQCHCDQRRPPVSLQRLEIDLGAEGCPAFGDGDQLPNEDLPRLGHEYVVQRSQQLVLALGGEQLDRASLTSTIFTIDMACWTNSGWAAKYWGNSRTPLAFNSSIAA